jgi:hypothetical protein
MRGWVIVTMVGSLVLAVKREPRAPAGGFSRELAGSTAANRPVHGKT